MPRGYPESCEVGFRRYFLLSLCSSSVSSFASSIGFQSILNGFFLGSSPQLWMMKDLLPALAAAYLANRIGFLRKPTQILVFRECWPTEPLRGRRDACSFAAAPASPFRCHHDLMCTAICFSYIFGVTCCCLAALCGEQQSRGAHEKVKLIWNDDLHNFYGIWHYVHIRCDVSCGTACHRIVLLCIESCFIVPVNE
ncbi:hypothetical protein C4B63_148g2 [Trypanosoma cruzi]|uniref:Protein root UVB sensitive/RUS domain-containing protein n=1 Tax=Trypanosoma cruzi TaxID=5693 RepID=A0A2V2UMV8_TRYCR|nr:hypothetical protein C4B63_148g2 [Trypanosoma cruzi]